jgi:hypothetical protein
LSYAPAARDKVLQLVDRERECCPFLIFTVQETSDAVTLTIEAPERARVAADTVFEPFQQQTFKAAAGCGCCLGGTA